jgi:hypothetical protein
MAAKKHESKFQVSQALKDGMDKELTDLEARMARLRVLYDQYFMGIERMEPTYLRGEVDKIFRRSQILKRGNTVFKFRFRSLQQRYTSYRSYWDRIVRMIEDGKMRRGVNIMSGRLPDDEVEKDQDKSRSGPKESLRSQRRRFRKRGDDEETSVADAATSAAAGLQRKSTDRNEFSPKEVQALYDCLVREKQQAGEATGKLSATVVQKSVDKILAKVPQGKQVAFRVVSTDGHVTLKAVVKKSE